MLKSLATGLAILALSASAAAAAATHHHHRHAAAAKGGFAEPAQPIAYSKLDAYLTASPAQRAHGDWGLDSATAESAATGSGANVSATAASASDASPK